MATLAHHWDCMDFHEEEVSHSFLACFQYEYASPEVRHISSLTKIGIANPNQKGQLLT